MFHIQSVINKATATVTNDYEERKELRHPENIRTTIRFSLTLVMAIVLILAIIILVENQANTKLSRKAYKGITNLPGFSPVLSSSLQNYEDLDVGLVDIPVQCPCSRQIISWTNFTKIYSISKDSGDHLKETLLNGSGKYPDMCEFDGHFNLTPTLKSFCIRLLQAYIGDHDQRTYIQSTNLLPPIALQFEVFMQMKTNLLLQQDLYSSQALHVDVHSNLTEEQIYYIYIIDLIGKMIVQQWHNTSSSIKDFWERGKLIGEAVSLNYPNVQFNTELALGMAISWDAYEGMCHPKICDHIDTYSLVSKIFHATSLVGGFFSIVLFIVRAIVWPAVLRIFSFPQKGMEASSMLTTSL